MHVHAHLGSSKGDSPLAPNAQTVLAVDNAQDVESPRRTSVALARALAAPRSACVAVSVLFHLPLIVVVVDLVFVIALGRTVVRLRLHQPPAHTLPSPSACDAQDADAKPRATSSDQAVGRYCARDTKHLCVCACVCV
jgi:hypothetical protein